jgi:hypothetical protein
MSDDNFQSTLESLIKTYKDNIKKIDPTYSDNPEQQRVKDANTYFS